MKGENIFRRSIGWVILLLAIVLSSLYIKEFYDRRNAKVLDYIELKHNYKNCIIIGKSDNNDKYRLFLFNPYLHNKDDIIEIDYTVYVHDYTYFNNYIGDTIK